MVAKKKKAVKRKRRAGMGKAKGAAFERHIAKLLSLWVTDGKREDVFWRSAMSGGRATIRNRKGNKINVRQAGDICSVSPEGHTLTDFYYFELKHVKKLALDQFIIKNTGPLAKFWKIAVHEAYKHSKVPVIIARQNGWPDIVVTEDGGGLFESHSNDVHVLCDLHTNNGDICVALLSDLLSTQVEGN